MHIILIKNSNNIAFEYGLFTGMCVKCGRSIMGENAGCTALEQLYHVECFRCGTCSEYARYDPVKQVD